MSGNPVRRPRLPALFLGAAVAAALTGAALAQTAPPPRDAPAGREAGRGFHHAFDPAQAAQHLTDALQLRPDQAPALQAFIAATAPPEKPPERPDREAMDKLSLPEKLDREVAHGAERQAALQRRAEATKRFYVALTPAQQKAFEAFGPGPGGFGRHHGGPGPWGHPGGMGPGGPGEGPPPEGPPPRGE